MYFFTADEHYGHKGKAEGFGVIAYCNRPFKTIEEMDEEIIRRHNALVGNDDVVIHAGDFCWCNNQRDAHEKYISKLNGNHVFLEGSHDHWLPSSAHEMWEKTIDGEHITVCHYPLYTWPRSHYNAWHLYGHTHSRLKLHGKSYDIGVDNNNFYPVSWDGIKEIMKNKPDNPNLIKHRS